MSERVNLRKIKLVHISTFVIAFCLILSLPVFAKAETTSDDLAENYEKDYLSEVFNSDDGLDGTAENCIYSSSDGLIWIGGYTGLYRYDGTEFKSILIDGTAKPVNDIAEFDIYGTSDDSESSDGIESSTKNLWVGTNGNGLYYYDGDKFSLFNLGTTESGVETINVLYPDSKGNLWVGTKAGLFKIEERLKEVVGYYKFAGSEVRDITELSTGEIVIVEKYGGIFICENDEIEEVTISGYDAEIIPRCVSEAEDGLFYIGTKGDVILKVNTDGEVQNVIQSGTLSAINEIKSFNEGEYIVCSDSGVGIIKNDKLAEIDVQMKESVEQVCMDYQGGLWFASSRKGILNLSPSNFSNLGTYWNINGVVNSIQIVGEKTYVGTDDGLYCFVGETSTEDELTKACQSDRIREIYKDSEGRLWVASYSTGIKVMTTDGKVESINTSNSDLAIDQIRCIREMKDGSFLVGTEAGLYVCNEFKENDSSDDVKCSIHLLIDDDIVGGRRILDAREGNDGKIYAGTDGNGLFVIDNGEVVQNYTKDSGLLSDNILKVVPSNSMDGVWIVMSEGICFLSSDGELQKVTCVETINSLDMLLDDNGNAIILASNGMFTVLESDLLKTEGVSVKEASKQDGLPIDFTANSWSIIDDGVLYLCGSDGAASVSIDSEEESLSIRLYVESVYSDGESVKSSDGSITIPSDANRISFVVRPINYIKRQFSVGYSLIGTDEEETIIDMNSQRIVSYTNLDGGKYTYHYRVIDPQTGSTLIEIYIPVTKEYGFWEEPGVKTILLVFFAVIAVLCILIIVNSVDSIIKMRYRQQIKKEKEREINRMAYYDMATGVYNRNYFEQLSQEADVKKIYAAFTVGVNHIVYYRKRNGILYVEDMLRACVDVLKNQTTESNVKIFRLSDNIFFFCLKEPVNMEEYIFAIKDEYAKSSTDGSIRSLSVGGVYNETERGEQSSFASVNELVEKCEKMRTVDENLAESRFVEAKINILK